MSRRPQNLLQCHLFLVLQLHMSQPLSWHMQVSCKQPCVVKGWRYFSCHWAEGGLHSRGRASAGGLSKHRVFSDVKAAALLAIFALVDDMHASLIKVEKLYCYMQVAFLDLPGVAAVAFSPKNTYLTTFQRPQPGAGNAEKNLKVVIGLYPKKYRLIVVLVGTHTIIFVPRVSCGDHYKSIYSQKPRAKAAGLVQR